MNERALVEKINKSACETAHKQPAGQPPLTEPPPTDRRGMRRVMFSLSGGFPVKSPLKTGARGVVKGVRK